MKKVLYFLKASDNNDCIAVICGKPVNQGDMKGTKKPFFGTPTCFANLQAFSSSSTLFMGIF